jgi:hypothetical protein
MNLRIVHIVANGRRIRSKGEGLKRRQRGNSIQQYNWPPGIAESRRRVPIATNTSERPCSPYEQKIASALSDYRRGGLPPSVAVCRRALVSLSDLTRRGETGAVELQIRNRKFQLFVLRAGARCIIPTRSTAANKLKYQNGHPPPYEAGEHWCHCTIRPAGAMTGTVEPAIRNRMFR